MYFFFKHFPKCIGINGLVRGQITVYFIVSQKSYIMTEKALLYFADFNFCFVLVQSHGKIY